MNTTALQTTATTEAGRFDFIADAIGLVFFCVPYYVIARAANALARTQLQGKSRRHGSER